MLKEQVFIILVINMYSPSCAIDSIYDTGKQVWKLYAIIDKMEFNISEDARVNKSFSWSDTIIEEMGNGMDEIHEQLRQMEHSMRSKKIWDAVKSWSLDVITVKNIDSFDLFIERIDKYYKDFHLYRSEDNYDCGLTFGNFLQEIFLEVEPNIEIIRNIITQKGHSSNNIKNLPSAIAGFAIVHQAEMVDGSQIVSNILMHLFRVVMIAEMKANMMLAFANIHRFILNERRRTSQSVNSLAREHFEKQFGIYLDLFSLIFVLADKVYWRAGDPANHKWIRGDTFYELEKTFHTSLLRYHWFNCKYDSCDDVRIHKSYQCKPRFYDHRSSCNGAITGCVYLSAIQACILKEGPRKFQYVNSTELGFLGHNSRCPADNGYIIEDGTSWNISYGACVCNCYNDRNEISLAIAESNVRFNRVIIGLRFVRSNGIIFIQPKEASLEANGYINRNTQRWLAILNLISPTETHRINSANKIFFLDDVRLPPGCVLTGVKFNRVTRGTVTGFAIEIFGRNFDYRSGKLDLKEDLGISKKASNMNSGKMLSFTAVSSIYTSLPHAVTGSDKKYISLKQSRLTEDFGQSTLPLFDGVPVSIRLPSALDGIGVFHKGVEGYAGFISFRVYGIKLEKYFSDFKAAHMIDNKVLFNDSHYS